MRALPFKVSARTARLIGRENVTNADGAIIELVKNCYDADSTICIILFDIKYTTVPEEFSWVDVKKFSANISISKLISTLYNRKGAKYVLKEAYDQNDFNALEQLLQGLNNIFIIDNGVGMTDKIIEDYWMTIGTNHKEKNVYSDQGRIRTGAKGIGRFALDRLGNNCEMITVPKGKNKGYKWNVCWGDFEEKETINEVKAQLEDINNPYFYDEVVEVLKDWDESAIENFTKHEFTKGTIIKISNLRDDWKNQMIEKIYANLETLIPPKEQKIFEIYLMDNNNPKKYRRIENSICDDFDYKIFAEFTEERKIKVATYRSEFNTTLIDENLYSIPSLKSFPYTREVFEKGFYEREYDITDLVPGYKGDLIYDIGVFDFTLYFMKKNYSRVDKSKFFYNDFNPKLRNDWLNKFGGIKLFRDMFRIRPYGEIESSSFDWLNLGDRADKSPAAPTHKLGKWRVRPNQLSGSINISRLTNINFEDKSSREGLQENDVFVLFKNLIINIVRLFETDRQTVMRAMDDLYSKNNESERKRREAKQIANKVIQKTQGTFDNIDYEKVKNSLDFQTRVLAERVLDFEKEKEELISEMKMLRALGSTGLVITSFAHELKNISANILPRTDELIEILTDIVPESTLKGLNNEDNPFTLIKEFREQDSRLKNWLDFSLDAIRKDKRTRKKLDLYAVFNDFEKVWRRSLSYSVVNLKVPKTEKKRCFIRVFPIDIDSIFNNLIANSVDAFQREDASEVRIINIDFKVEENKLHILYEDSGPGLSNDIKNENEIFESFYTTKRDALGREVGTGLGMWIVKSTVEEYRGTVEITKKRPGFGIKITLPLRKDEGMVYE
ncbi:sensor histidine kinase [Bacillus sp. B-jedd]|uniref:sensor histidine kinase n=1 Tax=Bacillus sp. B-jedd TaxID=1476857 RepID=UPI0005155E46|nr:sensor histidine kinase [Bacillus sp. B-jedd]CEG25308.1 two-component sensor histidine kinase [Bacillus sp. B-jedd]